MGRYDEFFDEPVKQKVTEPVTDTETTSKEPLETTQDDTPADTLPDITPEPETLPEPDTQAPSDEPEGDSTSATAAQALAEKKESMAARIKSLHAQLSDKRRFMGDSVFNQMVAADWFAVIEVDPESFDALLYRPLNVSGVVDGDEDDTDSDSFTELDNNQRDYEYADPVMVTLRVSNDGREAYQATDSDTAQDGLVDDFMMLSIAAKGIPKGSMLEWKEEQLDGSDRIVGWHVSDVFSFGTQHVGTIYYCIPSRTYDTTSSGLPE